MDANRMSGNDTRTFGTDSVVSHLSLPPHSIEAEQNLLGGLLINNEAWDQVADLVKDVDFYRNDHRKIYRHICKLIEANKLADVLTVAESMKGVGELDQVGGFAYIQGLSESTASTASIREYADIIRDRSVKRTLATAGEHIADSAYAANGKSSKELIGELEKTLLAVSELGRNKEEGPISMSDVLGSVMSDLDDLSKNPDLIGGVPSGFADLDSLTTGLYPGDLIIVAGRPSMGKTSLALNIGECLAIKQALPVLVFSMEMGKEQLTRRSLSSVGGVDAQRIRTGRLDPRDWDRLNRAIVSISQAPLFIDDTAALTPQEMRARARRVSRLHGGLGLIIVDYLQLMATTGKNENRTTEISEISRSLKAMAKELQVPVIALSQLNRSLESRPNKRPVMSDLRESGAIEQDADVIIFIYRDEVYNPESSDAGTAEIILSKQRNGPIGTVRLAFSGQYTRFDNLAHMHRGGDQQRGCGRPHFDPSDE